MAHKGLVGMGEQGEDGSGINDLPNDDGHDANFFSTLFLLGIA